MFSRTDGCSRQDAQHKHLGILMTIFSIKTFQKELKVFHDSSKTIYSQFNESTLPGKMKKKDRKHKRQSTLTYKDIQTSGKNEYSRYSGFPNSSKTNTSKFQINQDQEPLCGCATSKSLFIIYLLTRLQYPKFWHVEECAHLIFGLQHTKITKILQSLSLILSEDHNNDQTVTFFATKQAHHSYSLCDHHSNFKPEVKILQHTR